MFKILQNIRCKALLTTIHSSHTKIRMAHTRFEYVKSFELEDKLEPLQWIVLHVKCLNYNDFLKVNKFVAPPEISVRDLMVEAASIVMSEFKDVCLGYGYYNAFTFVLQRDTNLYKRRGFKLVSNITSLYTAAHVKSKNHFVDNVISKVPIFEGSLYLLPQDQCLRDFLTNEQYACHQTNLEETTLRHLIRVSNLEYSEALKKVKASSEGEKNEILFTLCNINYNNEPVEAKKGTILLRQSFSSIKNEINSVSTRRNNLSVMYKDFNDEFWEEYFPFEHKTKRASNYNYHSSFQKKNIIIPHNFLVVRIDGKGFHKFSELHNFEKPNDKRSLDLMTASAQVVMRNFPKIKISYGQSDEYSFVLARYGHREKEGYSLISRIVSIFTSAFVENWDNFFKGQALLSMPVFDARLVLYPSIPSIRDYLSWRQADCHINNMYNICFWKLVIDKGLSRHDAQKYLKGTFSKDKLTILREEFGVDYYQENPLYRKGTVVYTKSNCENHVVEHCDIIEDLFWTNNSMLLAEERQSKIDVDAHIL